MQITTLDSLWPISPCPKFLIQDNDVESSKLHYRLFMGEEWKARKDAYDWITNEYELKHEVNQWITQKYPIRCTTLTRNPGDCVYSWEAKIGNGVYILFTPKIPSKNEQNLENSSWSVFYINLIWRDLSEHRNENSLWAGRRFIKHLELMPNNPIKAVYMRPVDVIKDKACSHLIEALNMKPAHNLTVERLITTYQKALGTIPTKQKDVTGKPYYRVGWWNPPSPKDDGPPFEWPDLLDDPN